MTKNLHEPSNERGISRNRFLGKDTRQKPLAFRWWEPGCTVGTAGCTGDEPPLENGFAQPSDASGLEKFAFRRHADGSLEFRGHLDASGAASGTVAVTLPGANGLEEYDFLIARDQNWHTTIRTAPGTSPTAFTLALVEVNATTGAVKIYWPAV